MESASSERSHVVDVEVVLADELAADPATPAVHLVDDAGVYTLNE